MKAYPEKDGVAFILTKNETVVLCELLCRFTDTDKFDIVDKAEAQILWNMCAFLEKFSENIFSSDWEKIVQLARDKVRYKEES